jgi:SAM-dependent methyltransferase
MVAAHIERSVRGPACVLDAGSGTGHYLARITATLTGPVIGLGLDISKDGARQAARRWPALAFTVADLWGSWPVHDAVTDLVVSIFAPKNFLEMARVLRCGEWLALAYPGPKHLIELRDRFGLLRQDEDKPDCDRINALGMLYSRLLTTTNVTGNFSWAAVQRDWGNKALPHRRRPKPRARGQCPARTRPLPACPSRELRRGRRRMAYCRVDALSKNPRR